MGKNTLKKTDIIVLSIILIVAFVLRMYQVTAPLSDFHSWRQADTAAVARNFARNGFDLLHPRYDDLSSIQSGRDNPTGLRYVEFPLYNALVAAIYRLAPVVPIEVIGRIVTAFFSLALIAVLYYFVLRESSRGAAIAAAVIYAVFPAIVFFSRVVLPETPALACAFFSILFLYLWDEQKRGGLKKNLYFILSALLFACALLIKPPAVFFGITLAYLFLRRYQFDILKRWQVYLFFLAAAAPLVAWRLFISQYPEGIPASGWLITSVNTYAGQKTIFFRPAFFRWIFYERIGLMTCGTYLVAFLIPGLLRRQKTFFLHSILFSTFAYLFVFQGGNVQHEYYQTFLFPAIAIFGGIGTAMLFEDRKKYIHPFFAALTVGAVFAMSVTFSYYYRVKDFYSYPEDLNQMANIIDTFTKPGDKIITDRLGDTTLLYMADRKGAPMLYRNLQDLQAEGYVYYITDKKEVIAELKVQNTHHLLFENNQFAFFKL